jgi:hypothetical protein
MNMLHLTPETLTQYSGSCILKKMVIDNHLAEWHYSLNCCRTFLPFTPAGGPASTVFSDGIYGLAPDSHGSMYVTDRTDKRVKIFAPDGTAR